MKKTVLLSLLFVYACSSHYRAPESITEKMDRFKAKNPNPNPVAEISLDKKHLKNSGRFLASAQTSVETKLSNKRLYFLSLVSQYQNYHLYSKSEYKDINVCAHFHTSLIEHKENHPYSKSYKELTKPESKNISDYPELALTNGGITLQEGIEKQIVQTHREIKELCEYGVSDNYYAYENLLTHLKAYPMSKNLDSLQIVLRLPVFANDLILSSIEKRHKTVSRFPASNKTSYLEQIQDRMNAKVYSNYKRNLLSR